MKFRSLTLFVRAKQEGIGSYGFQGSVKCRLRTDLGILFALETMGLSLSRTHLHGENNSPQSALYTDRLPNMWLRDRTGKPT